MENTHELARFICSHGESWEFGVRASTKSGARITHVSLLAACELHGLSWHLSETDLGGASSELVMTLVDKNG
jgi:hypothetical protein